MTIEELAEGVCAPETVSRIINRRVSPKRSTVEALLDKLGLRGVLLEDVMVLMTGRRIEYGMIWYMPRQ